MPTKLPYFTIPFLLLSCVDQEAHKTERWKLDSFEGVGICVFTFDPITMNPITETFLGLNDSVYMVIELHISDDETFAIVKNENVALTGRWCIRYDKTLRLTSNSESWDLEIITQNADSLVLKADAYPDMRDVQITLKH